MNTPVLTEEQKPSFLTFLIYGILFANDLVCDEIALAYNKLKKHPLFRHQVKFYAKKLYTESVHYKSYIRKVVGEQNNVFLSDSNAIFNDGTENHVQTLHLACKSILDKHNVQHSDIIAHWCFIDDLCHIAVAKIANSDRVAVEQNITTKTFQNLSLAHIKRLAKRMKETLYHGPDIDFNKDENYCTALKVLTKKLRDADVITKAICKDE